MQPTPPHGTSRSIHLTMARCSVRIPAGTMAVVILVAIFVVPVAYELSGYAILGCLLANLIGLLMGGIGFFGLLGRGEKRGAWTAFWGGVLNCVGFVFALCAAFGMSMGHGC